MREARGGSCRPPTRPRAAAGLDEELGPYLGEGETLPDHAPSFDLAGRQVAALLERLMKADDVWAEAVARHSVAQRQRRAGR